MKWETLRAYLELADPTPKPQWRGQVHDGVFNVVSGCVLQAHREPAGWSNVTSVVVTQDTGHMNGEIGTTALLLILEGECRAHKMPIMLDIRDEDFPIRVYELVNDEEDLPTDYSHVY